MSHNKQGHGSLDEMDNLQLSSFVSDGKRDSYSRIIGSFNEKQSQEEFMRLFRQYKMVEPMVERWILQYGLGQQQQQQQGGEESSSTPATEKDEIVWLDLGCGPGHDTALLCDIIKKLSLDDSKSVRVIGMDLNLELLKQAKDQYESSSNYSSMLTFLEGSATEIPLPDASVDLIYIKFVLQHISGEKRIKVLKEVKRVLKPNKGRVLIVDVDEKNGPFCIPEPVNDGFQQALNLFQNKLQAKGEDGNDRQVVRKLPLLLREHVGFPRVRVRMDAVIGGADEEFTAEEVFQTFYAFKFKFIKNFDDEQEIPNVATWFEDTMQMVNHPNAVLTYPIYLVLAEA